MLATCSGSRYVYEPFNPQWNPSLQDALAHFCYAKANSELPVGVEKTMLSAFQGKQTPKQLTRAIYRGYWRTALGAKSRIIVKDPTAVLMSEWLQCKTNAQVLVVVRHPCGFASSIESLDWKLNIDHLRVQEQLMSDFLSPFEDLLTHVRGDPWLTIGAYWAAIHTVIFQQAQKRQDWILCNYEDLCLNPVNQFTRLAAQLSLEVPATRWRPLKDSTAEGRRTPSPSSTRRDSVGMPEIWKQRLSEHKIDAIQGIVREFGLGDHV